MNLIMRKSIEFWNLIPPPLKRALGSLFEIIASQSDDNDCDWGNTAGSADIDGGGGGAGAGAGSCEAAGCNVSWEASESASPRGEAGSRERREAESVRLLIRRTIKKKIGKKGKGWK